MHVHLQLHTIFSPFDGAIEMHQLIDQANRYNMGAVCVTDHHNVFAWSSLHQECQNTNIKPLYGCELNVGQHHLTVIAMNDIGLRNIIQLNNFGYKHCGKANISEQELFQCSDGVIALSGCSKGKIPTLIREKKYKEAILEANIYKKHFGDRFYIELQSYHTLASQKNVNNLLTIGDKLGIRSVATNDCHYLKRSDFEVHRNLVKMNTQGKLVPYNQHNYFKSTSEMECLFEPCVLEESNVISERCDADYKSVLQSLSQKEGFPLSVIHKYEDADALKKVFFSKRKYKLGRYLYNKMIKSDLLLEDMCNKEEIQKEVNMAFGLRGKIKKITADPHFYIMADQGVPLYRSSKDAVLSVQLGYDEAQYFGFEIFDTRKQRVPLYM
ncbi:PHP domain-containing protein (plasmid) [Pontibacillus sp. ALD_SL1]|uniref:PHP domain-containing protein n=1 Tax=Pontibacillus sp. ALD_SL1 TaxID=2777185 RepID=UPI001A96C4CE|nr:PHP domain-containing protein [Pontibacillus sp. ALD_SL1]QST02337.1 PHP domain-containing protein [Pontibacillus sp. ALD_SL1]